MTKHLASSMRNGGVLHRTRLHQSVIKFGQRYYTGPVSDAKATKAGAEMLVCYTLLGVTYTAVFWHYKNIFSPVVQQIMRDREDRAQAKAMDDEKP
ncbi:hypothetical protein MTR67_020305 [Solanum verrucosum]|uniref:Uncharacterized protein n=1 Tax=Solanum verrucosum TaxID=315347 RepID=A0AAF0TUR2_SOLVR|nr:hypothetical protein MTR67_020305 [Solanum verrucosum]